MTQDELNRLIAERLIGWKRVGKLYNFEDEHGGLIVVGAHPSYFTYADSWAGAGAVIEAMRKLGYFVALWQHHGSKAWLANFCTEHGYNLVPHTQATDGPEAVAKAALAFLEEKGKSDAGTP